MCVMGLYGFFCGKTRRELFGDAAEQAADIFDADGCKHAEINVTTIEGSCEKTSVSLLTLVASFEAKNKPITTRGTTPKITSTRVNNLAVKSSLAEFK